MSSFEGAKFLALIGRDGAGKDTAGRLLVSHGILHISTSDILRVKTTERGRDPSSKLDLAQTVSDLYDSHGPGVFAEEAIRRWQVVRKTYIGGLAVSGFRRPQEIVPFRRTGRLLQARTAVWFLEASEITRYTRLYNRANVVGLPVGDNFATFRAKQAELDNGQWPGDHSINLNELEEQADTLIDNNDNAGLIHLKNGLSRAVSQLDKAVI